ncbi:MAG: prohibitin family protein [Oscillospiraceae bacterium]|jgi:regulator of protease activity HflC (stomatin/prohibitin superfamily)|nr:prohibitin family protein [Oscillospiraceae bacterium]
MLWLYAAAILAIAVFIMVNFKTEQRDVVGRDGMHYTRTTKVWKIGKRSALALLPLLLAFAGCIATVPAGHTGVLVTFGRVEDHILTEGVNFILPYQNVVMIDNRVQKYEYTMEAFSSDIQQTDIVGSINFTVDRATSQDLYRNVGVSYYETVIYPRVLENIKLVFSAHTAEGLIGKRTELADKIRDLMSMDMKRYGIEISSVNIENIDFTDAFTNAVEAKQVAQQRKLTTQTEQESEIIIANAEAEKQVIAAEAAAARKKIDADASAYSVEVAAKAEAEANQKIAQSLTPELIEYTQINRWNGTVPSVQANGGGTVYPIVNID